MILKQILPNIYYIVFNNRQSLGLTFLRMQEHYESPKYKGKVFTLKEYKDWYKYTFGRKGKFTYCSDFVGYNLPDYAFSPFIEGKFDPLSKSEKWLIEQIKNLSKPFYVVGINLKENQILSHLKHEIAHGLWHTNKRYKKEMETLLGVTPKPLLNEIYSELRDIGGYHQDVFPDEAQAYLIDYTSFLENVDMKILEKFKTKFETYYNKNLITNVL